MTKPSQGSTPQGSAPQGSAPQQSAPQQRAPQQSAPQQRAPRLSAPGAVLFDWDSTLVDNWGTIAHALNATLTKMGQAAWSMEEVRTRTKKSARDAFPELFGTHWQEALDFFYARFEDYHLAEVQPLAGAVELLDALADHAIPLALVSNKHGPYLRAEAEKLGWTARFTHILGATDTPKDKPAPQIVHAALEGTGIVAGAGVWFVGDSVVDLECAHHAACVPILVEGGSISAAERAKWPPLASFASRLALKDSFIECMASPTDCMASPTNYTTAPPNAPPNAPTNAPTPSSSAKDEG